MRKRIRTKIYRTKTRTKRGRTRRGRTRRQKGGWGGLDIYQTTFDSTKKSKQNIIVGGWGQVITPPV